jgi:hypothetical protein
MAEGIPALTETTRAVIGWFCSVTEQCSIFSTLSNHNLSRNGAIAALVLVRTFLMYTLLSGLTTV